MLFLVPIVRRVANLVLALLKLGDSALICILDHKLLDLANYVESLKLEVLRLVGTVTYKLGFRKSCVVFSFHYRFLLTLLRP